MQSMERTLHKARKGVDADRPLSDLAPMFEGLRASFERLSSLGATYEQKWVAREEHQRQFLQAKSVYLDGLQSHMLGDEAGGADGKATKIFRKAAYVAETYRSAPMRTVV